MPIAVFLADDNLLIREGVRALIELDPDLEHKLSLFTWSRSDFQAVQGLRIREIG